MTNKSYGSATKLWRSHHIPLLYLYTARHPHARVATSATLGGRYSAIHARIHLCAPCKNFRYERRALPYFTHFAHHKSSFCNDKTPYGYSITLTRSNEKRAVWRGAYRRDDGRGDAFFLLSQMHERTEQFIFLTRDFVRRCVFRTSIKL
jgi:hypothetical protein